MLKSQIKPDELASECNHKYVYESENIACDELGLGVIYSRTCYFCGKTEDLAFIDRETKTKKDLTNE